jgi:hypothetical protein
MSRCNLKRTFYSLQTGEGLQGRDFRLKNKKAIVVIHHVLIREFREKPEILFFSTI